MKREKGKLKQWLKDKGKNALGVTLDAIGSHSSIPVLSDVLEGIGESLMNDPDLTVDEKAEAAELIGLELEFYKAEMVEVTKRWEADNQQDLKFPKLIRPSVCAYSWVVVTLICILEACDLEIPSSSVIIGMCTAVNIAYFGSRGYEKVTKFKNKNR